VKAKIVFIVASREHLAELAERHCFEGGVIASAMDDGRLACVAYPRHFHTRFALADEAGVVVVPAPHDPEPIGDLHEHLTHIEAQPGHTSRQVHLRLHGKHGAAFHPDV
jgi:hypothetical protein